MTDEPTDQSGARFVSLSKGLRHLSNGVACLSVLIAVGGFVVRALARFHWVFEGLASFTAYIAAAGIVTACVGLAAASRRVAAISLVFALLGIWPVFAEWGFGEVSDATGPKVKVIAANVYTHNRDAEAVRTLITQESPDLFVLLEADDFWDHALDDLNDVYPHRVSEPRSDNFGIVLRSKLPLHDVEIAILSEAATPTVIATVDLAGGDRLKLVATHPLPPKGQRNWSDRNEQLKQLAALAKAHDGPLLIVGDLNVTPWSPAFRDLRTHGGLRDARFAGYGLSTTWNARHRWLQIPIDHALVKSAAVCDYRVGSDISSDHLPVIVTVGLSE